MALRELFLDTRALSGNLTMAAGSGHATDYTFLTTRTALMGAVRTELLREGETQFNGNVTQKRRAARLRMRAKQLRESYLKRFHRSVGKQLDYTSLDSWDLVTGEYGKDLLHWVTRWYAVKRGPVSISVAARAKTSKQPLRLELDPESGPVSGRPFRITITLETDEKGRCLSTPAQVAQAINNSPARRAVSVSPHGSKPVTPFEARNLALVAGCMATDSSTGRPFCWSTGGKGRVDRLPGSPCVSVPARIGKWNVCDGHHNASKQWLRSGLIPSSYHVPDDETLCTFAGYCLSLEHMRQRPGELLWLTREVAPRNRHDDYVAVLWKCVQSDPDVRNTVSDVVAIGDPQSPLTA